MKKIRISVFIFISVLLLALTPVKIQRMSRQAMDFYFYSEQSELWKKEVVNKPKNAEAWQNYFLALRYADRLDPKGPNADRKKAMNEIILSLEKHAPLSPEYFRCKVKNLDNPFDSSVINTEFYPLLEKGLALNPNDDDLLESMIAYCEVSGKTEKLKEYYTRLYNTNENPYPIIEYNYNVLMSLDKNAIVFTNGDNDSYPAWMLQQVKGIRTDVSVINLSLARIPGYLDRMLKQKNVILSAEALEMGTKTNEEFIKGLVFLINEKNPEVGIFFALTCDVENVFLDSLYCTGLAHKFSTKRFDNISLLKTNIETKFHLDYLNNGLVSYNPTSEKVVESFNTNYIVPFAMLSRYYKNTSAASPRDKFYRNYCMEYAAKMGKSDEIKRCLNGK
jgi:hypothetical protein